MTSFEVDNFSPFVGQHCETVATGTLLKTAGIELSEPMLFGLGEGLSFIFVNLKTLALPFVGGRVKPFALTQNLCKNLGIECHVDETSSKPKAWGLLQDPLRHSQPVGLQLDCYYLEYFSVPFHFAAHFVTAYGYDETRVRLVDTAQQGTLQSVARTSIEAARFAKGPMAARARTWTIQRPPTPFDLNQAVANAIAANAAAYLAPAFKGMSHLGIRKLAASLPQWLRLAKQPETDLAQMALLMERAGTGGSIFRNFYRDFLGEAKTLLPAKGKLIEQARQLFSQSATEWLAIASRISDAGKTGESMHLHEAAKSCARVADIEVAAMQLLTQLDGAT